MDWVSRTIESSPSTSKARRYASAVKSQYDFASPVLSIHFRTFNGRVIDLDEFVAHEAHGQRGFADASSCVSNGPRVNPCDPAIFEDTHHQGRQP